MTALNWRDDFERLLREDGISSANRKPQLNLRSPRPNAPLSRVLGLVEQHVSQDKICSIWLEPTNEVPISPERNEVAIAFSEYLALKYSNADGAIEFAAAGAERLAKLGGTEANRPDLARYLLAFNRVSDE